MFKRLTIILIAAASVLAACDDYDTFTTDRSAVLQFSTEQVVFDTLITTIPSATKTLTIYNRGDKGLRVRSVSLARGAASPFRLNVDGQDLSRTADNRGTDFEVRRRDSIIVRMEVTVPEIGGDEPQEVSDDFIVQLESGVEQHVTLKVVGQDAFYLINRTLAQDTTLTARRPIIVRGELSVAEGVTVTMEAGTRLLFHDDAFMRVHGRVVAQGTLEKPVTFRGDRTDHIFDYLPYDHLPGRWQGIIIAPESMGNQMDYIDLHSGSYGILCPLPEEGSTVAPFDENTPQKLRLTNSLIHNIKGDGLVLYDCRAEVANCEISNTLGRSVDVLGGDVAMTHCTIAQFYPLDANRGDALHLANIRDGVYHPLYRADFVNTVITGYGDDVVMGEWADVTELPAEVNEALAEYHFLYCFLATEIPTGSEYVNRFVGCVYDDPQSEYGHDKNFVNLDTHALIYDFAPKPQSSICRMANAAYSNDWPKDRRGRDRLTDGTPDAGCYEAVE